MGKSSIKGAGGFNFDKDGLCTNPEQLLHFESDDVTYSLLIAQCNMGYLVGFTFDCKGQEPTEQPVKSSNDIFTKRELAMQTVGEQAWAFFGTNIREGKGKPIKPEFEPLLQYLTDVKSSLVAIIKKGKDDSTKKKPNPLTVVPHDQHHMHDAKNYLTNSGTHIEGTEEQTEPAMVIIYAEIKDDYCNYHYRNNTGKQKEFTHKVTNTTGIIDDDMKNAFAKLAVHLAAKDDIFRHSGVEIEDINTMHVHELATLYQVTGFKMKGGPGDESVVLIGNKYLSGGDRMELDSPKISIDNLSSYKWWSELLQAVQECQEEVLLYHEGKFTVKEKKEPETKAVQNTLFAGQAGDGENHDADFDQHLPD